MALVIVRAPLGDARQHGRTGCVRSSAWIWLFSSTQSTSARSGGERYRPTMSRTLSTKCGSLESLERLRAVRLQAEGAPDAPDRRVRKAAFLGHRAQRPMGGVRRRRRRAERPLDILGHLIVRERSRPSRPRLTDSPSMRSFRKRRRHLPTVCSGTSSAATALFVRPSAQRRIMRQRRRSSGATRQASSLTLKIRPFFIAQNQTAIGRPVPRPSMTSTATPR